MAKKTYRLWAVVYTDESAGLLEGARFSRLNVAEQYFLVYSDRKPKGGALIMTEVREADARLLSDGERKWLFECNLEILREETKARSMDVLRDLSLKVGALEDALRAEAEKEGQKHE